MKTYRNARSLPSGLASRAWPFVAVAVLACAGIAGLTLTSAPVAHAAEPATPDYQNALLAQGERVVGEVISKLRSTHVDGDRFTPAEYRTSALGALIRAAESPDFTLLTDPAERQAFVRDLWRVEVAGGTELGPVFAAIDARFGELGTDDTWKIIDTLARGAIATTGDPFTQYLDQKMLNKLMSMMRGGQPASFGFRPARGDDRVWKVGHVVAGYDAKAAGLLTGDVLLEANGRPLALAPAQAVSALFMGEGPAAGGKPVRFRVYREGWKKPHEVLLRFRKPDDANVTWTMLEGGIGYIRLGNFLGAAANDVQKALDALNERGMKALVFDVRDNPGGAITTCTQITDKFLAGGKIISTTRTRAPAGQGGQRSLMDRLTGGGAGPQTFKSRDRGTQPRYPMAVLINHGSASASEMFGGALKDHGRAVLVGQTSYGKGVGQGPAFLSSAMGQRFMMMTQLTYFNPAGETPQKIGVAPHVNVAAGELDPAVSERLFELTETGSLQDYVSDTLSSNRQLARKLAIDDGGRADRYPGLVSLAGAGADEALLDALRRTVRGELRAKLGDAETSELVVDRIDDRELQTALGLLGDSIATGRWPVEGTAKPARPPARVGKKVLY